jgi:hypothetical protein
MADVIENYSKFEIIIVIVMAYEAVSIISGTGAAICTAVVVAQCNVR